MLVFPNAKINLGLNIISKRQDGYHDLETCFYPVSWKDMLEAIPSDASSMSLSGIELPDEGINIVEKAYQLLRKDFQLPEVSIHLHKIIPVGAGLGGGSSDAAFALRLFNDMFGLGLTDETLMHYAAQLGADCAFFIKNKPMLAGGIGEKLTEIDISLKGKSLMLVYPGIHISTKEAYARVIPQQPKHPIEKVLTDMPIHQWQHFLINDFEAALFAHYPVLPQIKQTMYDHGALYASMSGSGSCMYGIFDELPEIDFNPGFTIWTENL
jgi:4-diphosphocytidyl-2-C-methyl-D-erythritol kinase